jgi:hypothetical protein
MIMHGRRRRKRAAAWLTAAVAALVLGIAAVTLGVLQLQRDEPEPPPVAVLPAGAPVGRNQGQVTVDLDPTSGYVAAVRGTDATRQFVTAKDFQFAAGVGTGRYGGEVTAFDPGTFDARGLQSGENVTINGHDARYVPSYDFAERSDGDGKPLRTAVVAWQDPSGVWVLTYADAGQKVERQDLLRLAASVTIAPPRDLRTPFRLGTDLPDGLITTYVRSEEDQAARRSGTVGLSRPGRKSSRAAVYAGSPRGMRVSVFASAPDPAWAQEKAAMTGRFTAVGHPAWYVTGTNPLSAPGAGGRLVVETEHCVLSLLTADRQKTGRDDLERIVQGMAIGDCGDPNTWIAPLS